MSENPVHEYMLYVEKSRFSRFISRLRFKTTIRTRKIRNSSLSFGLSLGKSETTLVFIWAGISHERRFPKMYRRHEILLTLRPPVWYEEGRRTAGHRKGFHSLGNEWNLRASYLAMGNAGRSGIVFGFARSL
jgi:hypothetical protein